MEDTYTFDRERATYKREKQRLLEFEGHYVIIRGDEVLGHWETADEAYWAARAAYGEERFMARVITSQPLMLMLPAFFLDT